jgi:hypothetical protein
VLAFVGVAVTSVLLGVPSPTRRVTVSPARDAAVAEPVRRAGAVTA